MLSKVRLENAEFAAWSAGVQSGTIPLEGPEAVAAWAGFRAGLLDLDDDTRKAATRAYTARERVGWAIGYGEGRAARDGPRVAPDARLHAVGGFRPVAEG